MHDLVGAGSRLGYCTNVHAGHDLAGTLANLERYAAGVRARLGITSPMGIGLWLSAAAAREARDSRARLGERLGELGLEVFTLNGFPFDDFHGSVVKHRVYEPDWADSRRLAYTLDLIEVLHGLLDEGEEGSISTLPIGWPAPPCRPVDLDLAAHQLRAVGERLADLERRAGRLIHLDLEPEPGCILQRSTDAVRFWEDRLLHAPGVDEAAVRRHLRICHDICHAAVVFEDQVEAFGRYRAAGIRVGKVQISSAIAARFDGVAAPRRDEMVTALRSFDERRYLHQTCVRTDRVRAYDDLSEALAHAGAGATGEWRVHFHIPVHLTRMGVLESTQDQIRPCLTIARQSGVRHFEVETYAWTVLPGGPPPDLVSGIAEELRWTMAAGAGDAP